MSNSRDASGDGDAKGKAITKTAGYVVLSGIAFSILKALIPLNRTRNETRTTNQSLSESTLSIRPAQPLSPQEPITKKPHMFMDQNVPEVPELPQRTIEIVKGDTLWGLSRKYGVSVNTIKEVNGLTGDTIYAGKKIIIP
ncbi:uncharacterized protein LOC132182918 [Corylus avellana]|uniref:uncharacterized protein LOC132182877 n=1 Tax=Corylus avellana TaxID=13451 RepID=UPI001E1F1D9D|nr:uncharacterized protein LOC132182877 [Corylus avellana]XP_059452269.1 uncharacterized protein LOC132182918 [Corylus avellana]